MACFISVQVSFRCTSPPRNRPRNGSELRCRFHAPSHFLGPPPLAVSKGVQGPWKASTGTNRLNRGGLPCSIDRYFLAEIMWADTLQLLERTHWRSSPHGVALACSSVRAALLPPAPPRRGAYHCPLGAAMRSLGRDRAGVGVRRSPARAAARLRRSAPPASGLSLLSSTSRLRRRGSRRAHARVGRLGLGRRLSLVGAGSASRCNSRAPPLELIFVRGIHL